MSSMSSSPPKDPALPCSSAQHRAAAPRLVRCAVLTVSDTRGEAEDKSGRHIRDVLAAAGHEVVLYKIVKDEPEQIQAALREVAAGKSAQAVLINGGTGIAPRDRTPEAVEAMFEKKLDGFGEIFRVLSYEEIGPAAMLSRAAAGTYSGMVVFAMPGSTAAVRLAMEKLILPEIGHLIYEMGK